MTTLPPQAIKQIVRAPRNIEKESVCFIAVQCTQGTELGRTSGQHHPLVTHFPNVIVGVSDESWRRRLAESWTLLHWIHVRNPEGVTRSWCRSNGLAQRSSSPCRRVSFAHDVMGAAATDVVDAVDIASMETQKHEPSVCGFRIRWKASSCCESCARSATRKGRLRSCTSRPGLVRAQVAVWCCVPWPRQIQRLR